MTKKIVSLFLALALLAAVPAFAEPIEIDGITDRNIKINRAGLNASADEVIGEGFSPTTGRALDEIETPDGFLGVPRGSNRNRRDRRSSAPPSGCGRRRAG